MRNDFAHNPDCALLHCILRTVWLDPRCSGTVFAQLLFPDKTPTILHHAEIVGVPYDEEQTPKNIPLQGVPRF
jgi:hypothetical protein